MRFGYRSNKLTSARVARIAGNPNKPQKTVFSDSMCAHVWAQRSQAYGLNDKGTLFFVGDTIYSYGEHFPIARFIDVKRGKKTETAVLFNSADYSHTTSKHKRFVKAALPFWMPIFAVHHFDASRHTDNISVLSAEYAEQMARATNVRVSGKNRLIAVGRADSIRRQIIAYVAFFKLPKKLTPKEDKARVDLEKAATIAAETREFQAAVRIAAKGESLLKRRAGLRQIIKYARNLKKLGVATKVDCGKTLRLWRYLRKAGQKKLTASARSYQQWAKHAVVTAQGYTGCNSLQESRRYPANSTRPRSYRAFYDFMQNVKSSDEIAALKLEMEERARRAEQDRLEWLVKIERKRNEREALKNADAHTRAAHWRSGGELVGGDLPIMLRVNGHTVETSRGAVFPADDARRAWPLITKIRQRGHGWRTNGQTIALGHFRIDAITSDGTIIAGCHKVMWEEVAACAKRLGLEKHA